MKKIGFIAFYICLGAVAFGVRLSLDSDENVVYYMSIINQIAGFATIITILCNVLIDIKQRIKKNNKSMKPLKRFLLFMAVLIIVYWTFIKYVYYRYPATLLNDIVTICTLTIALTTDLYESFLIAIFYKR